MPSLRLKCITSTERYLLKEDRFTYTYVLIDERNELTSFTIHSDVNYKYSVGSVYEIVPTKETEDGDT